jgi:hypothetical protein
MSAASWINEGSIISAQVDPAHPSYIAPVCFLDDEWSPEIVAANARLISAAPELLACLCEMLGAAEMDCMDDKSNVWRNLMSNAQVAIEKATGGAA